MDKKIKNPDDADAFVRSASTDDGTISPSQQDSFSAPSIPQEQQESNKKDSSVPPAQSTQDSDGIPAINESSLASTIPQEEQEITKNNSVTQQKKPQTTENNIKTKKGVDSYEAWNNYFPRFVSKTMETVHLFL